MQRHKERHELWLFLFGSGKMHRNHPPKGGDFALIRQMSWHQYTASKPTLVLEVQYGTSCEESDIERL